MPPLLCADGKICSKLEPFKPVKTADYIVTHGASKSWLRRDTRGLVQYATAGVRCILPGSWPLGLGDMSDSAGTTPKTASGKFRHPKSTHNGGRDIDIAYYQTGTANNYLRAVCPHTINGKEAYHCVGAPTTLDVQRSALFIAKLIESPIVRVIGVDGKIGPLLVKAISDLRSKKLISISAAKRFGAKVAWEEVNKKLGWYLHHLHHLHLSTRNTVYGPADPPPPPPQAGHIQAIVPPRDLPRSLPLVRVYRRGLRR